MAMLRRLGLLFLLAVIALPLSAQSTRTVIIQTNSAGDSVHLIDPATDKIVGEIPDAEVIHGVAAAPDGSRLYLSNESTDDARRRRCEDAEDHEEDSADRAAEQRRDPQGRAASCMSRFRRPTAGSTSSTPSRRNA